MSSVLLLFIFLGELSANEWPQKLLNMSLNKRCQTYLENNLEECKSANKKMLETLDFDIKLFDNRLENYLFIAFKKITIKNLSDSKVLNYLKDLNLSLDKALTDSSFHFNLWKHTLTHFSPTESVEIISSLFQDTSDAMTHIRYIKELPLDIKNEYLAENLKYLEAIIRQIQLLQSYRQKDFSELFFPKLSHRTLSNNIYHFYVTLYLIQELRKDFTSFIAENIPLIFICVYEMVSSERRVEYLFVDPIYFSSINGIKDIYTSYQAKFFMSHQTSNLKFQDFKNLFLENTTRSALMNIIH